MLDTLRHTRDSILPSPDVLHDRSKIATDLVQINGELKELPRFANEITSQFVRVDPIKFKNGKSAGDRFRYDTITSGGIDRGVSVFKPCEEVDQGHDFSILMDTAWFTGLEGHNNRVAEILMKTLGVNVVLVGPEFSSFNPEAIGAEMNLGRLAVASTGFSLFQSAEASAAIYSHLKNEESHLGLADAVYDVGESRGAMLAQIRRIFLECFGVKSVGSDLTDPNVAEQAFKSFEDSLKLLKWPLREAAGIIEVGVSNALHGELRHFRKTVPTDVRYAIGAFVGMGPALFSGEEGRGARYTHHGHPQMILNFKGSGAAQTDIRRENYADHPNTTIIERRGCHLSLAYPKVLSFIVARGLGFIDARQAFGDGLTTEQIKAIHSLKPSRQLRHEVVLEEAA